MCHPLETLSSKTRMAINHMLTKRFSKSTTLTTTKFSNQSNTTSCRVKSYKRTWAKMTKRKNNWASRTRILVLSIGLLTGTRLFWLHSLTAPAYPSSWSLPSNSFNKWRKTASFRCQFLWLFKSLILSICYRVLPVVSWAKLLVKREQCFLEYFQWQLLMA